MDFASRSHESDKIGSFFYSDIKVLIVCGEFGIGKSHLIEKKIKERQIEEERIRRFDFLHLQHELFSRRFADFLEEEYIKRRESFFIEKFFRRSGLKATGVSFTYSLPGVRTSFRFKTLDVNNINENTDEYLCMMLKSIKKTTDIIYINNADFCPDEEEDFLSRFIAQACTSESPQIILEFNQNKQWKKIKSKIWKYEKKICNVEIRKLDEEETKTLYKVNNEEEYSSEVYIRSQGIPLLISNSATSEESNQAIVDRKIERVSKKAEIITYCLAAACNPINIETLREISLLSNSYDESLLELYRYGIVNLKGKNASLSHPLYYMTLTSGSYNILVDSFGHRLIIEYLEKKKKKTHKDFINLFRHYSTYEDKNEVAEKALSYAYECYKQEEFRRVLDCSIFFRELRHPIQKQKQILLLLQTSIRIGSIKKAEKYANQLCNIENFEIERLLLKAQFEYLKNQFETSIHTLSTPLNGIELSNEQILMSLGIKTANYIAIGKLSVARNTYSECLRLSEIVNREDLKLELYRLSPEIEIEIRIENMYNQTLEKSKENNNIYIIAKALHNFSVHEFFQNGNSRWIGRLYESARFFECEKYPEFSYSAICISAHAILTEEYDKAEYYLENSRDFLHEQYDNFCWNINRFILNFKNSKYTEARNCLNKAHGYLVDTRYPLDDPYFVFLYKYNSIALSIAENQDINLIKIHLMQLAIPHNCFQHESKKERVNQLLKTICEKGNCSVSDLCKISKKLNLPELEVATLEFFDFNINVLPENFIVAS